MPRPTSENPRSIRLTCRFTPEEDERLARRAKAAGHATVSAFIRARCLIDPAERRARGAAIPPASGPVAAPGSSVNDQAVFALGEQNRRCGVVLNQLVRHLHQGQATLPEVERELRETMAEVRFIARRARELLP